MKEENKVPINAIRDALQEIKHYDEPEPAFKEAWESWRYWCIRHQIHTPQFFRVKWKDGWLGKKDAEEFCSYLIKDWHPRCLEVCEV